MTYEEMKAKRAAAVKARRAYPISDADYAAAQAIIDEMDAAMQAAPEYNSPEISQQYIDEMMSRSGFSHRGGNLGSLEEKLWRR